MPKIYNLASTNDQNLGWVYVMQINSNSISGDPRINFHFCMVGIWTELIWLRLETHDGLLLTNLLVS